MKYHKSTDGLLKNVFVYKKVYGIFKKKIYLSKQILFIRKNSKKQKKIYIKNT